MAFQLVINRVMGLCAFDPTDRDDRKETRSADFIAGQFLDQMREMADRKMTKLYQRLERELKENDVGIQILSAIDRKNDEEEEYELNFTIYKDRSKRSKITDVFDLPKRSSGERPRDPIVGLFKSGRYKLTIDGVAWDVRIRPSVTACVLERPDRLSKLWWTFEGVPMDPTRPPTEEQTQRFVKITSQAADAALSPLRAAYTEALHGVDKTDRGACTLDRARLNVCLADNTDTPFSTLVDAMLLSNAGFPDAFSGQYGEEARKGAQQVSRFITGVSGHASDPATITLKSDGPGLAAVYARPPVPNKDAASPNDKVVVAGLASALNMISTRLPTDDEWKSLMHKPELIRTISAARPLSASLADSAARGIDQVMREKTPALANG